MQKITLGQFYAGQSALGRLESNKFYSLSNCDIHSEIGFVSSQFAMASDNTTINEACFSATVPNGDTYYASKTTGKIWKLSGGTVTLANTNANTAHRGVRYFNGYLWYWTATKLGYYNFSAWTDTFATFTAGNARGATEHANQLLICDGRYLARVDATNTFSGAEFTMPAQYNATCVASLGDDVLVGTYGIETCKVFLWNSVSTSWSTEDEVFEKSINCFLKMDNVWLAQVGTEGNFYYWTGSKMAYFGRIRGIATSYTNGDQMTVTYKRRLLWANGTKIYSIHKEDDSLNTAYCGEYTCTGTIASLDTQNGVLLASVGTGLDKVSATKAVCTIETYEVEMDESNQARMIEVRYDESPENITIKTKVNGGSYEEKPTQTDTVQKKVSSQQGIAQGATLQAQILLDDAKIKSISIL
jgi:hypothetical protein